MRKSTGQRKIVALQTGEIVYRTAKEPNKEFFLLGSQSLSMGVLSDDFAAVDVREELCYPLPPEKAMRRAIVILLRKFAMTSIKAAENSVHNIMSQSRNN